MAETKSWWKSMTLRKKTKDTATQQDSSQEHQPSHDKTAITMDSNVCQENKHPSLIADAEYTEHKFESGFNEKTSRRNLKISRSGRFKEKRWVRAGLPENSNFYE
ncbi:PRR15 protein, partial [Polyodon spathula]|nr:PRR15 protein [Polyodon spathula]